MNIPQSRFPTAAVDSPDGQVKEAYQRSVRVVQGLTLDLTALDATYTKLISRWCVQSGTAIDEGGAPDWEALYDILKSNAEALNLVKSRCSNFDTYVTKFAQGLIGEKTIEAPNPHSVRAVRTDISSLILRAGSDSDNVEAESQNPIPEIARPVTPKQPQSIIVGRSARKPNPLVAAVAASAKIAKSGSK